MTAPYFMEVLARNGEVLQRQRAERLPIRVGRGYDNDFILDDPHTAAHHAVIDADENGQLVLRELDSRNGVVHLGKRQDRVALDGNTVVRLGHTRLRVRNAAFPVPAEVADTTMHAWEGGVPALAGLALIALFTGVNQALGDAESFQLITYLLTVASGLAAGLLWSGGWALANRLFGGHARMGRHLFILGTGLIVMGGWKAVSSILAYAWSAEALTRYGNHVVLLIACVMIFFHMRTIKPYPPRRLASRCAVLLVLGAGLVLLGNLQSTGRLADELYMSVLLPPAVRQSPDHSVDEFLGRATLLKGEADAARTRTAGAELEEDDQ